MESFWMTLTRTIVGKQVRERESLASPRFLSSQARRKEVDALKRYLHSFIFAQLESRSAY